MASSSEPEMAAPARGKRDKFIVPSTQGGFREIQGPLQKKRRTRVAKPPAPEDGGDLDVGNVLRLSAEPLPIEHPDGSVRWQNEPVHGAKPALQEAQALGPALVAESQSLGGLYRKPSLGF